MSKRRLLLPVLLTGALGLALLLAPGTAATWTHVYIVLLAAVVVAAALRELVARQARRTPSTFDAGLARTTDRPGRPEDLELLERYVSIGSASAYDLHYRLRPALAKIAAGILQGRGIDVATQPEAARDALGDDAWSLLRPDRQPPADREAPALTATELGEVVAAIERAR